MSGGIIKQLSLLVLIIAYASASNGEEVQPNIGKLIPLKPQGRSVYDQYTLGSKVDGSKIIYSTQQTQSFDVAQQQISLPFDYPPAESQIVNPYTITQVVVYLEASDGATTQAYVTQEGIGERSISLNFVANNSTSLHYMIVISGIEN